MPWYPWHVPRFDVGNLGGPATQEFTPITSVSRWPGHTEVFWVSPDGSVNNAWFYGTASPGGTSQIAPPGSAASGGGIAAASRAREYMEIWWCGSRGSLEHAYWYEGITGNKWMHRQWYGHNTVSVYGGVAFRAYTLEMSRVFYISPKGAVRCMKLSYRNTPFASPHDGAPEDVTGDGAASTATAIAHTSRKSTTDEIQWMTPDGSIQNAFRYYPGNWTRFQMAPPGSATGRSGIWAVSRKPEIMDLWWVGADGSVQNMYWFEGIQDNRWVRVQIAPPGSAFPTSGLAAISRLPHTVELWWASPSGSVEGAYWYEGDVWRRYQLAKPRVAKVTTRVSAIPQYNGTGMGVYYVGASLFVLPSRVVQHFFRDVREKVWPANIVSGGSAALGGWVNLTIRSDGSIWWRGDAHNSGADKYAYYVTAVIRPRAAPNPESDPLPPLAFPRSGRVIPTKRDDAWGADQLFGLQSDVLRESFDDYANGKFEFYTEYNSAFADTFEAAFGFLSKWILGTVLGGTVTLVIFIAVELGSLVATGSLIPGARIISGIFFMAGPDGTLIALGAAALLEIGSKQRLLTEAEYVFCTSHAYGTSLPPRDRIVLCDTIGVGDRPFCWPAPGGKISINMGKASFNDPLNHRVYDTDESRKKYYGETLIHEMGHVWQISHSGLPLKTLLKAIKNQIEGKSSYEYGPPTIKFSEFSLEAQAQIIAHWAVGRPPAGTSKEKPGDPASLYYKYILFNVQTGHYSG